MLLEQNKILTISLLLSLFFTLSWTACNGGKGKNIPDVSHIDLNLNIERFEQDLMSIDTNDVKAGMDSLIAEYPIFMEEIYLPKILPFLQDTNVMRQFLVSPGIKQLYDTIQTVYGDASDLEVDFSEAFKYYSYYFPERKIPRLVSFFSEYTYGTFTYEDELVGIGWDFFLGTDYPYYNPSFFPNYIKRSMNKEHLVAKTMEAVASDIVDEASGEKLLDLMINNGKILYVLDALLPYTPDSIKLGYTAAQTKWINDNELQLWSYLLVDDLLYSSNLKEIRKLVDHSPFGTSQMPQEAPGRAANWIGWQVIKSFMERNPGVSMQEMIEITDAQEILNKAKYKPKR
jgi:hypothetical protein